MHESILIAGSGGQGILFTGTVLAQAALRSGKEVSFFPSYGAEIRGGTANCSVIISDEQIGSPIVQYPDNMIIMNPMSLARFIKRLTADGNLVIDTSIIKEKPQLNDVQITEVPASEIAQKELKNKKVANMIILGAFVKVKKLFSKEIFEEVLDGMFNGRQDIISLNKKAFTKGYHGT
ncbi:MAG: 2-oxoacid:acceptor oxidoreductase family protein [bacterium]